MATSSPAVTPTITTKLLPQPKKDVAAKKAKKTKLTTEEEENSEKVGETSSAGVGGKDRTFAYKPRRWGERRKPEHETAAQAFKNRPEIAHLCLDYHPTTDHLRAVISRRRMTENLISLRIGVVL